MQASAAKVGTCLASQRTCCGSSASAGAPQPVGRTRVEAGTSRVLSVGDCDGAYLSCPPQLPGTTSTSCSSHPTLYYNWPKLETCLSDIEHVHYVLKPELTRHTPLLPNWPHLSKHLVLEHQLLVLGQQLGDVSHSQRVCNAVEVGVTRAQLAGSLCTSKASSCSSACQV